MKKMIVFAGLMLASVIACTKEVEVEKIVYREDTSITDSLRYQISSLQQQVNSLNTQNSSLNTQIQNLNNQLNELSDEINELEDSNELLESDILNLEAEILLLEAELSELENEVEDEIIDTESNELGLIYDFKVDAQKTNQYKISNSNIVKVYDVLDKETEEPINTLRDITIYTNEVYHLIEYENGDFKLEAEAKWNGYNHEKVTSIAITSIQAEALIQLFTSDGDAIGNAPHVAHKHDGSQLNLNSEKLWSSDNVEEGTYIRILKRDGNSNPKKFFWYIGTVETIYSNGKGLRLTRLMSYREDEFVLDEVLYSCRKY